MENFPVFQRARVIAFFCISFISLLWIVLLCLEIFWQWELSDRSERSLILLMLLTNTITVIMLPVLVLLPFRPWLDAARFMFLLVAHICTATAFAYWNPKFDCPAQTANQEGLCKLLNMYILICSWVIPVLLIAYAFGLILMVYRRSLDDTIVVQCKTTLRNDEESQASRQTILPALQPDVVRQSLPATIFPSYTYTMSQQPDRTGPLRSSTQIPYLECRENSSLSGDSRCSTNTVGRLSKRLPAWYF